ncbi:hypothetical protein M8C21_000375 [Ambrosia artemisiifolia]|uniref:Uncharacterized protein n=1 Tax=Ambrosia artemisiifolia TaxID=4212 RepID=A0AAD5CU15_AMBAR|nr:hypothetical protein M8C21_000375 [Ambrosia artemisiifolia]
MLECASRFMLVVNAELDSMRGVGIPSTPSLLQSSDLEKTQAELRQSFTAAEKFRRELEFLQKGGDPLDLKPGNAASISFQSTSLKDRHPEQFVTSEAKGSFAITASPHGDSVESSARLGAPSVCEPNSADNIMLLKESSDSAVLELPKKSYKRRIRSRPNRDPVRQASRDFKALTHDVNVAVKNSISQLENESDGMLAVQSTLGPAHGPYSAISEANENHHGLPAKSDGGEAPLTMASIEPESLKGTDQVHLTDSKGLTNGNTEEIKSLPGPTKVLDSESSHTQTGQHFDDYNGNGLPRKQNLESNNLDAEKHDKILSIDPICNEDGPAIMDGEGLKESISVKGERLWKMTAAAQLCRRVAFASRLRFQQQSLLQKQKEVSHNLAEAVMQFWHMIQVKCKGPESKCIEKEPAVGIQGYAMRFMEFNSSQAQYNAAQAPVTNDGISDLAVDHSWEDNLTEENLFYTVPPGAIEAYRKAIVSHLQQFERTGTSMQEEVDTSCYDAVADNAFGDDEGETNTYYLPGGFEGSKSTKNAQKRRKNFKLYGPRSYEMGADVSFMPSVEKNVANQPSVLSGKRSGNSLNVPVPTKRVRTASRQRIISSFNAGISGHIQALNRTDASSADTNSFHDEQSTLHGVPGAQMPNNMEAESAGDYEKQLQFDSMEVSNRPKKKKKEKHHGSAFEHRWQLDSNFQNDQKDHIRRRLDTHQFDSNGSSAASQMSNMSNPNKFMKLLVRDHGRKVKALKTPVGQPGSGSPCNLPSASAPHNRSVRDGRYGIPRTGPLSVDDQQRMNQYNRMLSARNSQQSSLSPGSHSVTDRGVRALPAGSGMGAMSGVSRNMKMARPGFPGIHSQSMVTSGSATASPSSMHSGPGPGPGNLMLRPRDPMHLIRANQNTDQKVSQSGTSQGVPSFGTNNVSPQQSPHMLNSNPHHPHHFQGPPNPAYAMRLAKERQLQQQRLLQQQQQQQQFSTSSPMMPHVQPQESQLPAVSSPHNSAAHSSSPPMSISPSITSKHPGLVRNPQTSDNQFVKQQRPRPSQQFQPHQQQQQAKLMKGGRGNLMIHQNLPTDSSVANGYPASSAGKHYTLKRYVDTRLPVKYERKTRKLSVVPVADNKTSSPPG